MISFNILQNWIKVFDTVFLRIGLFLPNLEYRTKKPSSKFGSDINKKVEDREIQSHPGRYLPLPPQPVYRQGDAGRQRRNRPCQKHRPLQGIAAARGGCPAGNVGQSRPQDKI